MATAPIFGEFRDPQTGRRLDYQRLILEHLPGKPLPCPCWISSILRLLAFFVPRCVRFPLLVWLRHPVIWWVKNPQYRLLQDVLYVDPYGDEWHIKAGFIFNGLSVPWVFWWICPPDHPDGLAAGLVHDYLCTPPYPVDSERAAYILWAAKRANGMYAWGSARNWFFVNYFGPQFSQGESAARNWLFAWFFGPQFKKGEK